MNISLSDVLEKLITSPNGVSRRPIYEGYDKNVQGNTVHERGATVSAVTTCFRDFPELDKQHGDIGVALGVGGNPNIAKISAKDAAIDGITQALVQISCVGATPLGATDCLNFGNPEKKDQMADLVEGIEGIKEVCEAYEIPIVSGNVSLYNESSGKSIPPSAGVAVFGRVDNVNEVQPIAFQNAGDTIFVIGQRSEHLGGSALMDVLGKTDTRNPDVDYTDVLAMCEKIRQTLSEQKIGSINQIRFGGALLSALVSAFEGGKGIEISLDDESEVLQLFNENPGVVLSTNNPEAIQKLFGDMAWKVGTVRDDQTCIIHAREKELLNTKIDQWRTSWNDGLREIL